MYISTHSQSRLEEVKLALASRFLITSQFTQSLGASKLGQPSNIFWGKLFNDHT